MVALQGVARHGRPFGILGILDHRHAASRLDRDQPLGPVVEQAGEHHPDHARTVMHRGRAEQRVHRRAGAVLIGAAPHQHAAGANQDVMIGCADIDVPGLERLPVHRREDRERADLVQQLRKDAAGRGRDVLGDEHRGGQIGGQGRAQPLQRVDPAGGRSDNNDVLCRHWMHLSRPTQRRLCGEGANLLK